MRAAAGGNNVDEGTLARDDRAATLSPKANERSKGKAQQTRALQRLAGPRPALWPLDGVLWLRC